MAGLPARRNPAGEYGVGVAQAVRGELGLCAAWSVRARIDAQVERRRIQEALRDAQRFGSALLACQPLPQPVGKIGTDGIGEISRRRLTQPAQQVFVEELL